MKACTMTEMCVALSHGHAWFDSSYRADRDAAGDWKKPVWSNEGGWIWHPELGVYQLEIR